MTLDHDVILLCLSILQTRLRFVVLLLLDAKDEAIAVLGADGLTRKEKVGPRENFGEGLGFNVFTDVEEDVGAVFWDLVLGDGYAVLVIVLVPLVVKGVLDDADIVAVS